MASKSEDKNFEFAGKAALVTGAGSGIGRATAFAFAKAGAQVFATDISPESAAETAAMIKDAGGHAVSFAADVAFATDTDAMVQHALKNFGRLNYAFNNAGISGGRPGQDDFDETIYDRVMAINAKGTWLGMKFQIPAILKSGGGAIVNMASTAGLTGIGAFAYTASKHAVIGLTKAAAVRFAGQGIRINAVCPGVVDTPMVARAAANKVAAAMPDPGLIGRAATPEEIADAVLWLCSPRASFVIGHPLVVDGGTLAS
jgi:NAD(P)-dependent dehydrogenase (short-subunit alcohol dehydrogenase family)